MENACVKTLEGVLMYFFTSFLALVLFCRKYMCENSHWYVDVFFYDIFGVSSLRWIMQAAIVLKTIEDC